MDRYALCKLCSRPEIPQCISSVRLWTRPLLCNGRCLGIRRSCDWQRQVPAVHDATCAENRPWRRWLTFPLCATSCAWWRQCRKLWRFCSWRSSTGWTMSLLCRSSSGSHGRCLRFSSSPFQFATRRVCFLRGYGGGEGFFVGFFRIFRAPPDCLELSASFRSPR